MNIINDPDVGVSDIFHNFGASFLKRYPQPRPHLKSIHLIKICRTSKLGGHLQKCNSCDYSKPMYNSCRSRMCPRCQTLKKERWVEARKNELLPCSYFHGVFTLPHQLNILALRNKKLIYNLLFETVSSTLQTFSSNKLKGKLGFISVLHTWNQKVLDHIHLHCIIPGGAFGKAESRWIPVKNEDFLFPVKALSKVFKAKFLEGLRRVQDQLYLPEHIQRRESFNDYLDTLWKQNWVVYAKRPFKGPEAVINYLGRYTHKTAISNYRIIKIEDDKVIFKYRDRRDGDVEKTMALNAVEFLRRFMLHTLPKRFHRIRHYGFLSHRFKDSNIEEIYKALNLLRPPKSDLKKMTPAQFILTALNIDITRCPHCKKGVLIENPARSP